MGDRICGDDDDRHRAAPLIQRRQKAPAAHFRHVHLRHHATAVVLLDRIEICERIDACEPRNPLSPNIARRTISSRQTYATFRQPLLRAFGSSRNIPTIFYCVS